jgi:hypothetical protein
MSNTLNKKKIFTHEGMRNITAFLEILRRIHARLMAEGYVLENGEFVKPDESDQ